MMRDPFIGNCESTHVRLTTGDFVESSLADFQEAMWEGTMGEQWGNWAEEEEIDCLQCIPLPMVVVLNISSCSSRFGYDSHVE